MNKLKNNFVTQYCNIASERKQNNVTIDNASKTEIAHIKKLQAETLEQSGLTLND